jgi:guanylate kinase
VSARVGFPVVVAAPSGTGKTTVCREVVARDPGIVFSVSHTTRPRRQAETDGQDYHFVSVEEFRRMADAGAFLEWAEYNQHLYGTSWGAIQQPLAAGLDVLLEIEVQGARQVRARRPDARLIFLLPPSIEVLRQRLVRRGTDGAQEIERRLALARTELAAAPEFDYAVVNDELEPCVETVLEVLRAERSGAAEALRRRLAPGPALARLGPGA